MRRTKGFTLIELLVVMAIISLLLGILLPALNNARAKARETKDGTQIKQIHQSWVTKSLDNQQGRFPLPGEINRWAGAARTRRRTTTPACTPCAWRRTSSRRRCW
ncbi:MAG: prepilin-type N-terminal cleavage/methylation domain-containing protein [Planctomycetes bacterium]|nr:prepilin-type N-terminal cleavage/methylation domain-containing protein [Planctomycetota bacterium]